MNRIKPVHENSFELEKTIDFSKPVQIGTNIYWVGIYLENDPFQCHPYFIDNGNESALIDPGSMIQKDELIEKIQMVCDLKKVKYIILHHQDPDLCAAVPHLEKLIDRDDLLIVTHSRMSVLIKHYGLTSDYYNIDQNQFALHDGDLSLEFYTTPYCHSPGAFITYEPDNKVLFSGDIFGGLEESWRFFAEEDYFKHIEGFHMAYMPSRDILNYALGKIEKLDIDLIAPQHGSLIKRELIPDIIGKMKKMNSGLYIDSSYSESLTQTIEQLDSLKSEFQTSLEESRALKKQQDGDYFLTTLLQKPLMKNENKSELVSTNFVIYQKKIFRFKNKYHHLGGDICITGNLIFSGVRYTMFFNGDSMGKSMQGAGGAIVMGTVLNSIVHRSARNDRVLNITPEEWMRDTYQEIHEIFLTFDGAMMISGVLGLINDETGEMIYLNAEHPWTVLLRNGKASFIETELTLRKFGCPSEFELELKKFQLEPGDILFAASDGRDDIDLTPSADAPAMNSNIFLFLEIVEKSKGNLEKVMANLMRKGTLTDDLGVLRVGYKEQTFAPRQNNEVLVDNINKLLISNLVRYRKYEQALELLQGEAEKMSPEFLFFRGYCHLQLGRFNRALLYLEMTLKEKPDHFNALKFGGYCHYYLKSYKQCGELWEQAHEQRPGDKNLEKNLLHLNKRLQKQSVLLGRKQGTDQESV